MRALSFCSVLIAALVSWSVAETAERVALVIGNGDYAAVEAMPSLPNPPNDAAGVAAELRGLGFEVIELRDGGYRRMIDGLRSFSRAASGAEIALFYYAGHGLQADGENYLMPVDASVEIPADLDYESLSLSQIKSELERSGAKLSMLILDACRNNPLSRTLKARAAQLGRSVSTDTGLARIEGATGMLIAYATDPGNVALDGQGEHSPFTRALIEHLDAPVDVRLMFGRVREQVYEATNGAQTPWVEEAVLGEYRLARRSPAEEEPEAPDDEVAVVEPQLPVEEPEDAGDDLLPPVDSEEARLIVEHSDELFHDPNAWVGGNPQGDVTLVEFCDYRAPYCKKARPVIRRLLERNPDIRHVVKEAAIGRDGFLIALMAQAALDLDPSKYGALRDALLGFEGNITVADAYRIAGDLGYDTRTLKSRASSEEVKGIVMGNVDLFIELGIMGTPGFVLEDHLIQGHHSLEAMEKAVSEARTAAR